MQGPDSQLSLGDQRPHEAPWAVPVVATVLAAVLIGIFAMSYVYGSAARAEIERANAAAIDAENRVFCTGLGLAPASDPYQKCTLGLDDIRRRHQERLYADMEGLL